MKTNNRCSRCDQIYCICGTPGHRLDWILKELHKRFPKAHNPVMSDPPEPKYFKEVDDLINLRKKILDEEAFRHAIKVGQEAASLDRDGIETNEFIYKAIRWYLFPEVVGRKENYER